MTKKDIIELMEPWPMDSPVRVVIADGAEHLDELEPGSVLEVTDAGFNPSVGNMLYVEPV